MTDDLLRRAFTLLGLSNEEIAERFDTSQITIMRWRSGTGPHPSLRLAVYAWLLELALDRLKRTD